MWLTAKRIAPFFCIVLGIIACTPTVQTVQPVEQDVSAEVSTATVFSPTQTAEPSSVNSQTPNSRATETVTPGPNWTSTPDTRREPHTWQVWPIVPEVSQRAVDIYLAGVASGNDPHAFTVIGDCQSQPEVFFGIYATDRYYFGTGFEYLEQVVTYFDGSFGRQGATVEDGMSVASVFSPLWAAHPDCNGGESPLECELRLNNPSIAIVSLGTNWKPGADQTFENLLRELVDALIAEGVLPILVTKADNVEEDNRLNGIIAQVAYDYDIPLWNFWRAVQHLPNSGLDTTSPTGLIYLAPEAWDVKSFTGIQMLDAFLRAADLVDP